MQNGTEGAAEVILAVVPIVGIVMGTVLAFFHLLWSHSRKMLMIQKGLPPESSFDLDSFSLLAGLVNLGVGLALTLFFAVKEGATYSLLGGLIPLSAGLSLCLFFLVRRRISK